MTACDSEEIRRPNALALAGRTLATSVRLGRVKIHFAGHNPARGTLPLAAACGVGNPGVTILGERRFERLNQVAKDMFEVVTKPEDSDVISYPHTYSDTPQTSSVARFARELGRECLFFHQNDNTRPLHPLHGILYRYSLRGAWQGPRERPMPAFCDDVRVEGSELGIDIAPAPYGVLPSVSFCGYVSTPARRLGLSLLRKTEKVAGLRLRATSLRVLRRAQGVDAHFIERASFFGGFSKHGQDDERRRSNRTEYLKNLFVCPYVLCLRGQGNFSFRFYEALAAGRVPLFIDTDCPLPFAKEIDWQRHVVWVGFQDATRADEIVRCFHDAHTPKSLFELQLANRRLWEQWLSPEAFFRRVVQSAAAPVSKNRT